MTSINTSLQQIKKLPKRWFQRGAFLDISKAFYKAWHEGLILKLEQYGISGNLLRLIKCFLENRKQRVVLNGQTSWTNVIAGVPQGSVLGPLFFLIYISMIYQMTYPPILNYLQIIPLFFQLCTIKTLRQKNFIMAYGKLVTGAISRKWISTPILSNKLRMQFSHAKSLN